MGRFIMLVCILGLTTSASSNAVHVGRAVDTVDYPRYAFNYAVNDPITMDHKAQWETRNGDVVKGSYSIVEPDGSLRLVDYRADDHTGFNAVVNKLHPSVHETQLVTPIFNPIVASIRPITRLHPVPLLPKTAAPLIPLVGPLSYGFGGAPIVVSAPDVPSRGRWSLPWDSITHTYGGWRPISDHLPLHTPKTHGNIYRSEYMDGRLHKWNLRPIPFGNTLIIKKIH